ncbi:MAG: PD-(D/E)XK nuclease family protein, partial [Clostridiales Family XIII bacterium]|nr:PD-(D/E)XK nuclease family protein [Clostridiales Family XIII bacterium]
MLSICYGREDFDRNRFLYDRIARDMASHPRVFLIVPEQFTLQAERDAFRYLDRPGFLDFDVLSLRSLGRRILAETGGEPAARISRYGKFMLLSRLLYRRRGELEVFRGLEGSAEFVEKLSDVISELKNFGVSPDGLSKIADSPVPDVLTRRKLADVVTVYEAYETVTQGRYVDTAGYLRLFTSKIGEASFLRGASVWFAGFDYLSPAMKDAVLELARVAGDVGVLLTADPGDGFFSLTNELAAELSRRAGEMGLRVVAEAAADDGAAAGRSRPEEIAHIERALFTAPHTPFVPDAVLGPGRAAIRLAGFANCYVEAEAAAAAIVHLVRDRGLRYRDILVLCNDLEGRGRIIARVFERFGLPVFLDQRRRTTHNPVTEFILALPEIAARGRRREDVFRLLKTGLSGISDAEVCELENYAFQFAIEGRRWERPFAYGLIRETEDGHRKGTYSPEELAALNAARARVVDLLLGFEQGFKAARTAGGRTDCLLRFLREDVGLEGRIADYADLLEEEGRLAYAAEMRGIGAAVFEILEQMQTVLGDVPVSLAEYATVLRTGFESIRLGILPTAMDQILVGTTQRTRAGEAQAIFVLGANDGVLPARAGDGGMFTADEMRRLAGAGYALGKGDEALRLEEQLAIYRCLSAPRQLLYVSYASSDSEGRECAPSMVFGRLRRLFPHVPVEGAPADDALVQHADALAEPLAARLREWSQGGGFPAFWLSAWRWASAHAPEMASKLLAGLSFRNRRVNTEEAFADGLLSRTVSPSQLERYSRCSFAWFLDYALRLRELPGFGAADSRSLGDLYHNVLMRFGQALSADGMPVHDAGSLWQTASDAEVASLVRRLCAEEAARAEETAPDTGEEAAEGARAYRQERMARVLEESARALVAQVRSGQVERMLFEVGFGAGGEFPAIPAFGEGTAPKVHIQGRIDRVDLLAGGMARVIDYKSGGDSFSLQDVLAGWQLQLMLYLRAVANAYEPVGAFYFKVGEPRVQEDTGRDTGEEIVRSFRPDGLAVEDEGLADVFGEGMAGRTKGCALPKEEFRAVLDAASDIVGELCRGIVSGSAAAQPKRAVGLRDLSGHALAACDWCRYKGVCNYD